jgi:hypothetical protein
VILSERQEAIIAQREDQQHAEQVLEDRRKGAGHEQAEASGLQTWRHNS